MRIDSATVKMGSTRSYRSYQMQNSSQKTLMLGLGALSRKDLSDSLKDGNTDLKDAGQQAQAAKKNDADATDFAAHLRSLVNTGRVSPGVASREDPSFTIKQRCAQFLLEMIFGSRRNGDLTEEIRNAMGQDVIPANTPVFSLNQVTDEYYYREEECTAFSTIGVVKTADGREISFNLECTMSRSFEQYYRETHTEGQISYLDPLVINLDSDVAQVSDQKFFFDLDCDGTQEEISLLKKGSGFLALDRNGDGVIGDGSELFGTKSGDGFGDLAQYDEDGNGWIDEGDPIWEKLLIWTKDDEGQDKLYHLSDLGIGAICLSNVSTEYAMNSEEDNQNLAMIRKTGIFLYENGMTSTVQHLDLAR